MATSLTRSFARGRPRARLLKDPDEKILLACGVDPACLPILTPKLRHVNLLLEGVRLYAANILKQTMLSLGGDVAVHRGVISGTVQTSDCLIMGDLRHYRALFDKLQNQPGLKDVADTIQAQVFGRRQGLQLSLCGRTHTWDELPVIMGILNLTPDSFSDGGAFIDEGAALEQALLLVEHGADILDIGGESSRPGAAAVAADEEIRRTLPALRRIAARVSGPLSIDTRKACVARAALDTGASIINDISALRHDPAMLPLAATHGAGVVLMHMRGAPQTMQHETDYADIIPEIAAFLEERTQACLEGGLNAGSLIVDPGIGFGKDLAGNLKLIRHISEFSSLGYPVLLGHSRKAFIGALLETPVSERQEGTDAVSAWAIGEGVHILRVHDVQHTRRIRTLCRAIRESP